MSNVKGMWMESRLFKLGWGPVRFSILCAVAVVESIYLSKVLSGITDTWVAVTISVLVGVSLIVSSLIPLFSPVETLNNDRIYEDGHVFSNSGRGYQPDWSSMKHSCGESARGSATLMREVLELPKEDQTLFPHNLLRTLQRDLLPIERYKINTGIDKTLKEIKARNQQREYMERSAIPTEDIVAALERAYEHVKIGTDTLKQFS